MKAQGLKTNKKICVSKEINKNIPLLGTKNTLWVMAYLVGFVYGK